MKTESKTHISYSGMMYAHDFQLWYTYLKRRIKWGWRPEELSFLLGKPDHAYLDFERMFQPRKFLMQESTLLDRLYASSDVVAMEFHREKYELSEERLVRMRIHEDEVKWRYSIEVPWTFETGKKRPAAPKLQFEEWKSEKDLQHESDAMLHVRQKMKLLLEDDFFADGVPAWQLFQKVSYTGQVHLQIYPRHLKNVLYGLIQQSKLILRNVDGRYVFHLMKRKEVECII
ncbi:hypothetical protein K7A41_04785 [Sphingobacterium sp. InxBP1]|uniref:hypothetical protein n=1 Tax=Sphingobacterium sp. InxBP1 TaxID=2870328 RepID=UPI002243D3EB|nr:hypothetical protein [Sphingobacterium sp. InxBP1]MCW8310532.1 hypothetical protein [Sphingobacterium sp. InxBP1]